MGDGSLVKGRAAQNINPFSTMTCFHTHSAYCSTFPNANMRYPKKYPLYPRNSREKAHMV
ncbi:hypothetical protein E2C01_077263 [Portunus trituberculatus]|uniref:Uncharacterized protein n=1 Tax=Portunus trituberculatus TaxID=210409 RepID=A0A5B7IP95_PORTR|nr:hypothetical protein [Portunus trituberculatus]